MHSLQLIVLQDIKRQDIKRQYLAIFQQELGQNRPKSSNVKRRLPLIRSL